MDIKRTGLFGALAIVSYLMVLQWNQDYGQAALPNNAPTVSVPPATSITTSNYTTTDVPNLTAQLPSSTGSVNTGKLVSIRTDVLDITVDLHGGDVIGLGLTKYPFRQDRPDVPFQIFERSNSRIYEAQSGLIGDGPDKPGARPLYTSAETGYPLAD